MNCAALRPGQVFALVALVLIPQIARAADERVLVFVDDVAASDPKLKAEVGALTSALCGAVAKEKRFDVLCAPDVRQILGFAAASSMIGTASPAVENVQARLELVKFVVSASLVVRGGDAVLTLQAGPTAEGADPAALYSDKPLVKLEETTPAKQMKLLDKLPLVAQRLTKALLADPAGHPPTAPLPPPAPLK